MEHRLQFNRILLVFLMTRVCATQATSIMRSKYRKVETGQNITGNTGAVLNSRCSTDVECNAYQYQDTRPGNCLLIDTNSTENGTTFLVTQDTIIYKKACVYDYVGTWTPPCPWTGPHPVKYWSFNTLDVLTLMEATVQRNFNAKITGRVNKAVSLDRSRKQWIDLGFHPDACVTKPDTCGEAGGALSLWMKPITCVAYGGIISSWTQSKAGLVIFCNDGTTRFLIQLPDGKFSLRIDRQPTTWTHVVVNYVGPHLREGDFIMGYRLQFRWILLVLLMITGCATQTTFVENLYKKLEQGQNTTGKIVTESSVRSTIQCSVRCSKNVECKAYQYKETLVENCLLIDTSMSDSGVTFFVYQDSAIYKKECIADSIGTWTPPCPWTGPYPVKHWSFDTLNGLTLMEGTIQTTFNALTNGKVNNAVSTDHSQRQWIDLGVRTEACITRPETCSVGGAISFWMKLIECRNWAGIISSWKHTTGFSIYCRSGNLTRFLVYLPEGHFYTHLVYQQVGWTHVIFNYLGPEEGMGTRIYLEGAYSAGDSSISGDANSIGDSRLVIGRRNSALDRDYASVELDELLLFNATLSEEEIKVLSAYMYESDII